MECVLCIYHVCFLLRVSDMIEARFKFHPVGQGGFYSGKFYNDEVVIASVVYDCGTITQNSFIRDEIATW